MQYHYRVYTISYKPRQTSKLTYNFFYTHERKSCSNHIFDESFTSILDELIMNEGLKYDLSYYIFVDESIK